MIRNGLMEDLAETVKCKNWIHAVKYLGFNYENRVIAWYYEWSCMNLISSLENSLKKQKFWFLMQCETKWKEN